MHKLIQLKQKFNLTSKLQRGNENEAYGPRLNILCTMNRIKLRQHNLNLLVVVHR